MRNLGNKVRVYGNLFELYFVIDSMDDDIRIELHDKLVPCTAQEFVSSYVLSHEAKHGKRFEVII